MSASPRTEKTIFLEAAEIASPTERAAFLERSCGNEPQLRAAVEALLQSHQRSQGVLDATEVPPAERPGTQIGPYKLLQQIGEGGMGTVYMAEQTRPVQRKVALKIIKPGMDSQQVIARFEAERQALAMMDHVNIARVLDAGATEAGRPYFVMELVHGVPITKYCDDNHLTPRERLELFVPVCQAIQHAHQKGIIHRDIKPSNVMITLYDGKPVPKVIDFGVAKATEQRLTERTLFTQYGNIVGTLEYMSPEQAEMSALGVDTRSDIYSLGVLLYELLAGSTPLSHKRMKEAAYGEILRMIMEEEPPKPSTRLSESGEALASISAQRHMEPAKLTKLVRGELDWIVMKTLEKDRNRRYETASGLAMDVQRYLNDETVHACPPSAMYRFHKFARRNRAALAMAAVVAVALLLGIVGTTWQAIEATRERENAVHERDRAVAAEGLAQSRLEAESEARAAEAEQRAQAETQRAQAEANFQKARQAVDEMYTEVAEKWLASQPKLEPLQREFLQKALRFYEEFAQKTSADPAVRLETAQAFRRVADIQIKLGEVAPAEHAFRQGIDRLQALADEFPDAPAYRQHLAVTLLNFTALLGNTGRYPDAEKALRRALDLQEKLVADFPTVPEYRRDLGRSHNVEGRGRARLRQRPEAEKAFRAALAIQNRLVSEFPSVAEYRKDLADSHIAFSGTLDYLGQPQEQRQALNDGVGILEKLVAEFPANPEYRNELATAYYWLAGLLPVQEAESAIRKALDLQEKLAADFPSVTDLRYDLLRSLDRQAGLMAAANRIEDAEKAFRRAAAIGDKLVADAPAVEYYRSRRGTVYIGLAALLRNAGRLPEAEAVVREILAIQSKRVADFPDEPGNWGSLHDATAELGNLLRDMGRLPEAEKVLRQELDLLEKLAAQYSTTAYFRNNLAHLFWDLGLRLGSFNQDSEAERAHRRSLAFYDKLAVESPRMSEFSFMRAHNHGQLGALLQKAGKLEEAEQEYRRSIELFATTAADFADIFADHQWGYNGSRDGFVSLLKATGRAKEVEAVYRHDIDLYARLAEKSPKRPELRANQAKVYWEQAKLLSETGRRDEAEETYRQAIAIGEALVAESATNPDYRLELAHRHHDLANLARNQVRPGEAEHSYRRALALKEQLVADFPANLDYRFHLTHTCLGLGSLLNATNQPPEAEKLYRQAVSLSETLVTDAPANPAYRNFLAECQNTLAWHLVTSPDVARPHAVEAVERARSSTELRPDAGAYWNTLGVAHYRVGEWKDAIDALKKSDELLKGEVFSANAFFLAMAHWQLGEKDEARKWFNQAVQWMEKNKPQDEELKRFRNEAAELLGEPNNSDKPVSAVRPDKAR